MVLHEDFVVQVVRKHRTELPQSYLFAFMTILRHAVMKTVNQTQTLLKGWSFDLLHGEWGH